jgi:DNA-binding beta-propeller fold protein YncE
MHRIHTDQNLNLSRWFRDGPPEEARFDHPSGVTVDRDGSVVVADTDNHRLRRIATSGLVTTIAGTGAQGYRDGPAATSQFRYPQGVAVDIDGNVIVSERFDHRIRLISPNGLVCTRIVLRVSICHSVPIVLHSVPAPPQHTHTVTHTHTHTHTHTPTHIPSHSPCSLYMHTQTALQIYTTNTHVHFTHRCAHLRGLAKRGSAMVWATQHDSTGRGGSHPIQTAAFS